MRKRKLPASAFNRAIVPTIACINRAKVPLGVDFDKMIEALQSFLDHCFVPAWGAPARLVKATKEKPGAWTMIFLDEADDDDAEGYHDLTKDGLPLSKVFVVPTLENGDLVSVTACHELCEVLIDPTALLWSEGPRNTLWAYEVCDACEEETFKVDGVDMSDFVFPAYFEKFRLEHPRSAQYDYLDKIKRPFQILDGGYSTIYRAGKVNDRFGSRAKASRFASEDRRFHRSWFREKEAPTAHPKRRR